MTTFFNIVEQFEVETWSARKTTVHFLSALRTVHSSTFSVYEILSIYNFENTIHNRVEGFYIHSGDEVLYPFSLGFIRVERRAGQAQFNEA